MDKKQILSNALNQTLKKSEVNGLDVAIWLGRHVAYFLALIPAMLFISTVVWKIYIKPEVKDVASKLDAPIIKQADENKKLSKKTYYLVKKMELVQNRTTSPRIVEYAEKEIEIEKLNDINDKE